ncbi:MAG: phenylacetate--CoA ligase family protein, partial [Gemmataceae bacterium]
MGRFTFKPGSERHPLRLAYEQLDRSQWLDPEQMRAWQLRRLRALVSHCKAHVPHYRDALAGIDPATLGGVEQLPTLTRRAYQEHFPRMRAEALPPGHRATGSAYTSGTTGVPIEVLQTDAVHNVWLSLFLRDLDWSGADVTGRLAAVRALPANVEGRALPHWHPRWADALHTGTSVGYDIHHDPRDMLAWLQQVRPDYVLNHPATMEAIARLAPGPWPGFKGFLSFAETLYPHQREAIERTFGVSVYDTYSSCEAGYIASQCPEGAGLHVHAENVLLEVLDELDRPCPPGVTGRAVVTVLHNYRGPLLRYDIGDEVTPGAGCRCGRGLPYLTEVLGKHRPHLRLP